MPGKQKPFSGWTFTLRSTLREFGEDGLTDAAAALTYYAVLSLFPALIALVALLSLFGQGGTAITSLVGQLTTMGVLPASAVDSLRPVIDAISGAPAPGLGLFIGLAGAVWSASNYVKAFGRAMNTVYEVKEGRPGIKLNLQMYALTAALLLLVALSIVLVGVSGPITAALASLLGLPDWFTRLFDLLKLPVLAGAILTSLALLYHFTPNVRQPRLRWISVGAVVALVIAGLASLGFGLYIGSVGAAGYDKTYGALAGVIIFLFWLWIMNVALLLGGELDAELERARQLRAGVVAEERIQLEPRDTRQTLKAEQAATDQVTAARRIRLSSGKGPGVSGSTSTYIADGVAADRVRRAREQQQADAAASASTVTPDAAGAGDTPRRSLVSRLRGAGRTKARG